MPERPPTDPNLYDDVAGTSSRKLVNAVEKVDGLSPEDEKALERGGRLALRGTMRRIGRWSLWVLFGLGTAIAIAILSAIGFLSYSHMIGIVEQGQAGPVLSGILSFFAGVAATLGVEFLWHLSTRPKQKD